MLKLRRHAKADEITNALLTSPDLDHCRSMVEEAGCELQPDWANGAWILLPMTKEQYDEAQLCTCPYHVIVRKEDEDTLIQVWRKCVPEAKWPKPRMEMLDGGAVQGNGHVSEPPMEETNGSETVPDTSGHPCASAALPVPFPREGVERELTELVVERTFIHLREVNRDAGQYMLSHEAPF